MASTTLEDITPSVYTSGGLRALGRACQGRCVVSWHCYRNDPGGMLLPVQRRGYRMLLPGHSVEQTKVSPIHAGEKLLKGTIYWKLYILYIWKKTKIRNKQLYYDGYYNYYDKKLFHLFISALCAAVFLDSVNLPETFHVSLSLFQPHVSIECIYLWKYHQGALVMYQLQWRRKHLTHRRFTCFALLLYVALQKIQQWTILHHASHYPVAHTCITRSSL